MDDDPTRARLGSHVRIYASYIYYIAAEIRTVWSQSFDWPVIGSGSVLNAWLRVLVKYRFSRNPGYTIVMYTHTHTTPVPKDGAWDIEEMPLYLLEKNPKMPRHLCWEGVFLVFSIRAIHHMMHTHLDNNASFGHTPSPSLALSHKRAFTH